jgi:hypothetical protein
LKIQYPNPYPNHRLSHGQIAHTKTVMHRVNALVAASVVAVLAAADNDRNELSAPSELLQSTIWNADEAVGSSESEESLDAADDGTSKASMQQQWLFGVQSILTPKRHRASLATTTITRTPSFEHRVSSLACALRLDASPMRVQRTRQPSAVLLIQRIANSVIMMRVLLALPTPAVLLYVVLVPVILHLERTLDPNGKRYLFPLVAAMMAYAMCTR